MSKLQALNNIAGLAGLVAALYDANATRTLHRVLEAIDEELAPVQTIKTEEPEDLGNDVLITISGATGTGKTPLYNIIGETLSARGFELLGTDTDGSVELLRVVDPAGRLRNGAAAEPATESEGILGDNGCDCPVCNEIRGRNIPDADKAVLMAKRRREVRSFAELLLGALGQAPTKH